MKKHKKYWIWDEHFNTSQFKLGGDIRKLVKIGKVVADKDDKKKFYGVDNKPWVIETEKLLIKSIFFRGDFLNFLEKEDNIWEMELNNFENVINKYLEPIDINSINLHKDILYVVFKDGFVSISGIIRRR